MLLGSRLCYSLPASRLTTSPLRSCGLTSSRADRRPPHQRRASPPPLLRFCHAEPSASSERRQRQPSSPFRRDFSWSASSGPPDLLGAPRMAGDGIVRYRCAKPARPRAGAVVLDRVPEITRARHLPLRAGSAIVRARRERRRLPQRCGAGAACGPRSRRVLESGGTGSQGSGSGLVRFRISRIPRHALSGSVGGRGPRVDVRQLGPEVHAYVPSLSLPPRCRRTCPDAAACPCRRRTARTPVTTLMADRHSHQSGPHRAILAAATAGSSSRTGHLP